MVRDSEENERNGLTRAGGKQLRVMPDGSLTVIQEPDRVRNSFVGSEVDIVDIKQGGTAEAALLSQEWGKGA